MNDVIIDVQDLTRRFGDLVAVEDVTFQVSQGAIFGLLGPNGSGKSTIIRMLLGILPPSGGEAWVEGTEVGSDPEGVKPHIAYMAQRFGLYEDLTVAENLAFYADLYRVPNDVYTQKARENLARFSLADWSDELIESYSHGMKQRLIMAAALLHDPEVIIVDEPMVGLDPVAIRMVKEGADAEKLVREHALSLAEHINNFVDYLD